MIMLPGALGICTLLFSGCTGSEKHMTSGMQKTEMGTSMMEDSAKKDSMNKEMHTSMDGRMEKPVASEEQGMTVKPEENTMQKMQ